MITIVDYDTGNLRSVANMLRHVGAKAVISADPDVIANAEKLILPGVGAFDRGMSNLQKSGLIQALHAAVLEQKVPILGICLGMQLMTHGSQEGHLPGLGWINAQTVRFQISDRDAHKVPHMGWNKVTVCKNNPLIESSVPPARFYFVHSYHVQLVDAADQLLSTRHEYDFTSAFQSGNIFGTQFHPEKSHKFGMQLLKNFACLELEAS